MISVVIPTFNRCEAACEAVRSVYAQTFKQFELLLVDDGSTECMAQLQETVAAGGGRYIKVAHAGVAAARNKGVSEALGEWIAFLDSDDLWFPEKLKRQTEFIEAYPQFRVSQTNEEWIRNGRFVNPRAIHRKPHGDAFFQSLQLCCISPSAVLIDRSLFLAVGGFDEDMRVCEDYDLWLRLATTHEVGLLEETLVRKFGGHADQLSRAEPAMDRFRVYSICKLLSTARLSEAQRVAALQELLRKASILGVGARKRANAQYVILFQQLCEHAKELLESSVANANSLVPYLTQLRLLIAPQPAEDRREAHHA